MQKPKKSCEHCGKSFEPRRSDQKYCDHRCRANSRYKRYRGSIVPRRCLQCASAIPDESNLSRQFCSPRCRQRYHYERRSGLTETGTAPTESVEQKRDRIIPTILESFMPLTAREILNKVDLPDTDANRRYLQRKVDECPEIKKSGENKGRTYCTKRLSDSRGGGD